MSAIPSRTRRTPLRVGKDITALIPDFPFNYGNFLKTASTAPLFNLPAQNFGRKVLIVGAGVSGLVSAYELMRLGLHPVIVEASDRIGGRLYSKKLGDPDNQVICELGGMRFPVSAKSLFHYFDKVGMTSNCTDFPNPGTPAAVSSVVDYAGEPPVYYEADSTTFPKPEEYIRIEDEFFTTFLGGEPFYFDEIEHAMTEGSIDPLEIKRIWNGIIGTDANTWDDVSFFAALKQLSGWSRSEIDLFGQIGFGTGGWNTDFPNSVLELLRVMYGGLDADHQLMYDGASSLPERLWSQSLASLGDNANHWSSDVTLESLTKQVIPEPFNKEVRYIVPNSSGGFTVRFIDTQSQTSATMDFDAVIYTPHVRLLDKLRYAGTPANLEEMNTLLPQETWEAVMYTHYMQSAKVFAATTEPFWKQRDAADGKQKMSVTLSDRLTRGTYLVDYAGSSADVRGSGVFLSYTWNDDSLKFLGNQPAPFPQPVDLCTQLLESIYPKTPLSDYFSKTDSFTRINWEEEPYFLGAFKMNLPGQYEYQRRIFSQFMTGVDEGTPYGFILAGDDVSWTAGWAEGAVTTALNAVHKVALLFSGASVAGNPGPIDAWDELKPIQRT